MGQPSKGLLFKGPGAKHPRGASAEQPNIDDW